MKDNVVLSEVVNKVKDSDTIFLYCFDPRYYKKTKYGSFKTGVYRAQFTIDAVANLRKNLRHIGCELLVACKRPEDVIPLLFLNNNSGGRVYVSEETTSEEINIERKVSDKCSERGVELIKVRDYGTLYHPDDLPFTSPSLQDMPDTFTMFRERVEKSCRIRPLLPTLEANQLRMSSETRDELMRSGALDNTCSFDFLPSLAMLGLADPAAAAVAHVTSCGGTVTSTLGASSGKTVPTSTATHHANAADSTVTVNSHPKGVLHFKGGEDEALQRLEQWMFRDDRLRDYFDIRNGMLGEAYSSKLSPWLALGCISAR